MDTLSRTGIVVPKTDGSDSTTAYRLSTRSVGAWAETFGFIVLPADTYANIPAAAKYGRVFHPTDAGREGEFYFDTGSVWQQISPAPPTDPAAGVGGLRTLGAGATQAAPGSHQHSFAPANVTLTSAFTIPSTSLSDVTGMALSLGSGDYDVQVRASAATDNPASAANVYYSMEYTGTTTYASHFSQHFDSGAPGTLIPSASESVLPTTVQLIANYGPAGSYQGRVTSLIRLSVSTAGTLKMRAAKANSGNTATLTAYGTTITAVKTG